MTDPIPTTPRRPRWPAVLLLIPLAFFLITGDRGISFGHHWDEPLLLANLRGSLQSKLLLPTTTCNYDRPGLPGGNYEYPSVLYWVGLATASPQVWKSPDKVDTGFLDTQLFTIRLRQACLAISSLAILAVGWLAVNLTADAGSEVLRRPGSGAPEHRAPGSGPSEYLRTGVRKNWLTGFIAAALLATSWQFAYHARWIAPDEIMTVFSTACLVLCVTAVRRESVYAIVWAAVMAGLATGTKYPGGLLVVPVLTAGWMARTAPWHQRIGRSLELLLVVAAVFFVTTPGALAQPWNFVAWVKFDRVHYGTEGHYGHTILNHAAMAMATGEFLSLKLPSTVPAISIGLTALAVIGAVAISVRSRRIALVILPFPLIYLGYFSQQIVLLVRNLLVLGPIIAALAAVGTVALADLFSRRVKFVGPVIGWGIVVAVFGAIAWNGVWVEYASESMSLRRTETWQIETLKAYAGRHPELRIFPSETIATKTGWPLIPPPNPGTRDVVASFAMEDGDTWLWPANVPNLTLATFGAYCVDFDSYPNWQDNRIVLLEIAQARRVPVGHIERIVRRRDLSDAVPGQTFLAYLGCGSARQVDGNGIRIVAVRGNGYPCQFDVAVPQPDARAIEADGSMVVYEITGLDPAKSYNVGWSWWDWNKGHRTESAWAVAEASDLSTSGSTGWFRLCDPTRVPTWPLMVNPDKHHLSPIWPPPYQPRPGVAQHADYAVPLPAGAYRDGKFRFVVTRDAGPDVMVTGIWLTMTGR